MICTEDVHSAQALITDQVAEWVARGLSTGRFPAGLTVTDYLGTGHIYRGAAEAVAADLRNDPGLPLATDLLCNVQPVRLTLAQWAPILENIALRLRPLLTEGEDAVPQLVENPVVVTDHHDGGAR